MSPKEINIVMRPITNAVRERMKTEAKRYLCSSNIFYIFIIILD